MADINSLLTDLGEGVASDADIKAFCQENYKQDHRVFENGDDRDGFQPDECPLVVVYPGKKAGGMNADKKVIIIGFSCVVHDDGKEESQAGVVRFMGGRRVEVLRQKVFASILENMPDDLTVESIDSEYATIGQFPFVSIEGIIEITEEKRIGADQFE